MKVYLSGPITGHADYMDKFDKAEKALRKEGMEVINPADIMWPMPESTTHEQYMSISIALLKQYDVIYMMEGWHKSKGACMEFDCAVRHGITITFEGGTVWAENRSAQRQQSLLQRRVWKPFRETMESVSSAT